MFHVGPHGGSRRLSGDHLGKSNRSGFLLDFLEDLEEALRIPAGCLKAYRRIANGSFKDSFKVAKGILKDLPEESLRCPQGVPKESVRPLRIPQGFLKDSLRDPEGPLLAALLQNPYGSADRFPYGFSRAIQGNPFRFLEDFFANLIQDFLRTPEG